MVSKKNKRGEGGNKMSIEAFLRKHLLGDCYWQQKKEAKAE